MPAMTTQPPRPGAAPTEQNVAEYARRILLAVTGLSPQVVTETLYALTQHPDRPFVPTEVHLLTTREGAERARLALLSNEPGWFRRLCRDYRLPEIPFDESCIHVLKTDDGTELFDIRSEEDNRLAADFITETVRALSSDPDTALHVSIAGGRKTMGFYLGYALSLFGREQDRLSHVLVSEPFESSWEFFYPTPYSRIITTRDNKLADTAKARVTLAEIPFVSLRHGQPEHLLNGHARFSEAVMAARIALGPPVLTLDLPGRRINAGGRTISLAPAELALLSVFARRAQAGEPPLSAPPKHAPDAVWAERYLAELRTIAGELADLDETERALAKGMDGDYFSAHLSKLRKILKTALGFAAAPYLIDDGGTRPRRYRLALPPKAVRFAEPGHG
jgi:CRISPR-associated protein (TIGR02584 family)